MQAFFSIMYHLHVMFVNLLPLKFYLVLKKWVSGMYSGSPRGRGKMLLLFQRIFFFFGDRFSFYSAAVCHCVLELTVISLPWPPYMFCHLTGCLTLGEL